MRTHETDGQESALVEVGRSSGRSGRKTEFVEVGSVHSLHYSGDGCTHLSVGELLGQTFLPGHHGQRLEDCKAIGDATTEDGIGAFGRNHTFEDAAELLHTFTNHAETIGGALCLVGHRIDTVDEVAVVGLHVADHLDTFGIHRMDDVRIVVVEGKRRTIGIPAIADIPFLGLVDSRLDAESVVKRAVKTFLLEIDASLLERSFGLHEEALFHTTEEEPVLIRRIVTVELLHLAHITQFGLDAEWFPKGVPSAMEAFDNVGSIDQSLSTRAPAEIVWAGRIDGIGVSLERPFAQLLALQSFWSFVIGQREPGCKTCHQAAESLHVGDFLVASIPSGRHFKIAVLVGHHLLQTSLGHRFEHGLRHTIEQGGPHFAVGRRLDNLLLGRNGNSHQHQDEKDDREQNVVFFHIIRVVKRRGAFEGIASHDTSPDYTHIIIN